MNAGPTKDGPNDNTDIRVPEVRLIDADGSNVGVVTISDALSRENMLHPLTLAPCGCAG